MLKRRNPRQRKDHERIKTQKNTWLQGCQIFHNYIRPHEALNGKTPSEACGIKIEGENKWLTLIQNAKRQQR